MRNSSICNGRTASYAQVRRAAAAAVEALERRTLMSIVWTDRGSGSDGFDTAYGASASTARAVVDRAIADWEAVVQDFNSSGSTYNVSITAGSLGFGVLGETVVTGRATVNGAERPTSSTIVLDNDGAGVGWYFDGSTADDHEFDTLATPFTADGAGVGDIDLYGTILHELGHAMGIATSSTGGSLELGQHLTHIGGDLYTLNVDGGAAEATMTSQGGIHFDESSHPDDLMNPSVTTGRRSLISDLTASVLGAVYNYTVTLPSQLNSFVTQLVDSTDYLKVNTNVNGISFADSVTIDVTGSGRVRASVTFNGTTYVETHAQTGVDFITVDTWSGVDNVTVDPSNFDPVTINGGTGADHLIGGIANDSISGGDGDDTLEGGDGVDTLVGGNNVDQLYGQGGNDSLEGGSGNDTLEGGAGHDTLKGGDDHDYLLGLAGNDKLYGEAGDDLMEGGTEDDYFEGGADRDEMLGGDGLDTLLGLDGIDTLRGEGGNDSLEGGNHDDHFEGGSGNDIMRGGSGNDNMLGLDGSDTLYGDAGNDTMDGGNHDDVFFAADGARDTVIGGSGLDHAGFGGDPLGSYDAGGLPNGDSLASL